MKKVYVTPYVEFERYELDANIASNCALVVTNGPAVNDQPACEEFDEQWGEFAMYRNGNHNINFYQETNCDCYYSASESGYWTS